MFWKRKPKKWRPKLVTDIERWMTDPFSSPDKVMEGVYLSVRVLHTTAEMAVARARHMQRMAEQSHPPARERLDGDG